MSCIFYFDSGVYTELSSFILSCDGSWGGDGGGGGAYPGPAVYAELLSFYRPLFLPLFCLTHHSLLTSRSHPLFFLSFLFRPRAAAVSYLRRQSVPPPHSPRLRRSARVAAA